MVEPESKAGRHHDKQAIWGEKARTEIDMTTTGSSLSQERLGEYVEKLLAIVHSGVSPLHGFLEQIRISEEYDPKMVDAGVSAMLGKLEYAFDSMLLSRATNNNQRISDQAATIESLIKALVAKLEKHEVTALLDRHVIPLIPIDKRIEIVDLASGIGRFLKYFSSNFKHVVEVDFVKENIRKAEEFNQDINNAEYLVDDVKNITFAPNTINLVFGNWILQYIDDDEIVAFLSRLVSWLVPGGFAFFHEGIRTNFEGRLPDKKENPAIFRSSAELYNRWFQRAGFEVIQQGSLMTYQEIFGNPDQVYWILQRRKQEE